MAEFGWAYVAGGALTGAVGPTGSIQLKKSDSQLTGSPNLIFDTGSNTLQVYGDISASVNISASYFYGDGSNLTNVGSELIIQEEGVNVTTAAATINFVGSVVTATNSGNDVTVTIGGSIPYSRRAVSATITASVSDTILGVSGAAAIDIRLPSAGDYDAGQYFTIKDESGAADTKNITILASGSQTIDGRNSIILESPYAAVNIYSDGTSKFFIY